MCEIQSGVSGQNDTCMKRSTRTEDFETNFRTLLFHTTTHRTVNKLRHIITEQKAQLKMESAYEETG
jgi:hypothetical protein